jgi:hypothetical protein
LVDRHTLNCPNQISIIALSGFEVCDDAHTLFVMKAVRVQIAEVETPVASHVSKPRDVGCPATSDAVDQCFIQARRDLKSFAARQ